MGKLKYLAIIVLVALLCSGRAVASQESKVGEELELEAEGAFLLDVDSDKILYTKNPDKPLYPASTTKIMTALLLLEHAPLDEIIVVGEEIDRIGADSSTADLEVGDRLTVAEMVYALMLPSGNDAAYTTAVHIGRKISGFEFLDIDQAVEAFVELMNRRARELGALNTNFMVPDGYHTPDHISTARDLALITLEACRNEFICQVVSSPEYHWQGERWGNTNRLLQQDYPNAYYPWATGFKTGYTPQAGHCLISTASGGGRELLAVILKSTGEERWQDMRRLLEYGFKAWQNYSMLVEGRQIFLVPITGQRQGQGDMMKVLAGDTFSGLFHVQEIERMELNFDWARGVADTRDGLALRAPIREGQALGMAVVSLDGEVLAEVEMIAAWGVKGNLGLPLFGGGVMLLVLVSIYIWLRKKRQAAA